jgi:hypothetical protein
MIIVETFEPGCQPQFWPIPAIGLDELVTNTLLSPSPVTAPLRRRHLTGDANARSTAIVNAAFHRQNPDHSARHHPSDHTRGNQNCRHGTRSAVLPVRNRKIRANAGAKSP